MLMCKCVEMNALILLLINLFIIHFLTVLTEESEICSYDFENDTELQNFDLTCDGESAESVWEIIDRYTFPPLPPSFAGLRVLQVRGPSHGCLITQKQISLMGNPKITLTIYWYAFSDAPLSDLKITLQCEFDTIVWHVTAERNGWMVKEHLFDIKAQICKVKLEITHTTDFLQVDKIEIQEAMSTCYVDDFLTTTSELPSSTDDKPSTTVEVSSAISDEPSTSSTTSGVPSSTDGKPSTSDTPPITSEVPSSTDIDPSNNPETPTTTDGGSGSVTFSTTTDVTSTEDSSTKYTTGRTTSEVPIDDPSTSGFSILYIVTIVAACGGFLVISCVAASIILKVTNLKMRPSESRNIRIH